jgi:hypothetical protein
VQRYNGATVNWHNLEGFIFAEKPLYRHIRGLVARSSK